VSLLRSHHTTLTSPDAPADLGCASRCSVSEGVLHRVRSTGADVTVVVGMTVVVVDA